MTETVKAYLAGLFDGEGYFTIYKRKHPRVQVELRMGLDMTCHKTVCFVAQHLGGEVRPKKVYNGNKPQWRWNASYGRARRIMLELFPYLVTKADTVKGLLDEFPEMGNRRVRA